jgi:Bacterial membrane protein YfhO
MNRAVRSLGKPSVLAVLFLIAWPLMYFWRITLAQGVLFTTDVVRLFYPFSLELARALNEGRLPLWTPGIMAGFPLFAEGQVGALYLPNLVLYKLLPTHIALSYDIILHLAWAGCGMFAWVRGQSVRALGAFLAGFIYAFNGTVFGHLSQPPVIAAMSWLPWLLFLHARFVGSSRKGKRSAAVWFLLTVLAFGAQLLCGSVQIAFLNTLAFGAIAFISGWLDSNMDRSRSITRRVLRLVSMLALPVILGGGVAAVQLLPTGELIGYSTRSATTESFVASYSLPPSFLPQFLFPFSQGEPSEGTGEYWSYFGLIPFMLALAAFVLRRDRRTIFFGLFALGALALALGNLNPVYQVIARVPPFSFFRVPARYLYLFVFATTFLAAIAVDEIQVRWVSQPRLRIAAVFVAPLAIILWLAATQPLDFWISVWQVLPWCTGLAMAAIVWFARYPVIRGVAVYLLIGIAVLDLAAYMPPFLATIDEISPISTVGIVPRSILALQLSYSRSRVITDESIFPSLPALRGSLFSNTALIYNWESAQAYSSLAFAAHEAYLTNLSPLMINLLNVRYMMVPLEPRPETKSATPSDAVALNVLNNEAIISPTMASGIEITAFSERAENLSDGTEVGEVDLRRSDGRIESFPLRLGIETADWDYARKNSQYPLVTAARAFPGFWRSFGTGFTGHTYLARFTFAPGEIIGVIVKTLRADVRLTVESVHLCKDGGCSLSLAKLTGKDDFSLAYMSDTVAFWENLDALPRAFVVHNVEIANDDIVFDRLKKQQLEPNHEVLLSDNTTPRDHALQEPSGAPAAHDSVQITSYQPEDVTILASTDRAGYLVLADSWYPGWNAFVDGKSTPISRADFIFRAVPIEPGRHAISLEYQPMSFRVGALLSLLSLLIALIVSIVIYRHYASSL